MQIEPLLAGDERQRLIEILSEFVRAAGLAGIVARCLDAAGQLAVGALGAAHVVAQPAVQRDRCGLQCLEDGFGVGAQLGVGFLGVGVGGRVHNGRD